MLLEAILADALSAIFTSWCWSLPTFLFLKFFAVALLTSRKGW